MGKNKKFQEEAVSINIDSIKLKSKKIDKCVGTTNHSPSNTTCIHNHDHLDSSQHEIKDMIKHLRNETVKQNNQIFNDIIPEQKIPTSNEEIPIIEKSWHQCSYDKRDR